MVKILRNSCLSIMLLISALSAKCQSGTGLYSLGSFDSHGFDTVNNGNLNVHFRIPIYSKAGRGGDNFSYSLVYDGLFWQPTTAAGNTAWTPGNFGWAASQPEQGIVGGLVYGDQSVTCTDRSGEESPGDLYTNVTYNRPDGTSITYGDYDGCAPRVLGPASDGSYLLNMFTIQQANGSRISVSTSSGNAGVVDKNGNSITWSNGAFVDTTGTTVLTIADGVYTFPNLSGTSSITENLQQYTVQTAFNCPGIGEYGPLLNSLVSSIQLPDGSSYIFHYEQTPGAPNAVTGRLSSITLPTGGVIRYTYSGSSSGCAAINPNGGPPVLTRTADNGNTVYDTTQSGIGTQVTRPSNAYATYQFTNLSGVPYETHRKMYSANTSVPIADVATCYNSATPNCDSQVLAGPIQYISTYTMLDGGPMAGADTSVDAWGNVIFSWHYDYGSSTARGSKLEIEEFQYQVFTTQTDLYTGTVYTNNEVLTRSTIADASYSSVSDVTYSYDDTGTTSTGSSLVQHSSSVGNQGNLTTVTQSGAPSPDVTTTYQYYNTGTLQSSTSSASSNNWTTGYTYDPTYTFLQGTNLPTPASGVAMSTGASTDLASGLITSSTGVNTAKTTIKSYDLMLRPTEVDYPDQGWTKWAYPNYNQVSITGNIDGTRTSDTEIKIDGYGRTIRTAKLSSTAAGNVWFQSDTCYDSSGRVSYQSPVYQGGGINDGNYSCTGAGNAYTYDGLNRVTQITNADGATLIAYSGRAKKVTDVNGVQKITQTDALGRISSVCEVSSSTSPLPGGDVPAACSQDIAANGFLTSYTYDLANHKTTVTQGLQQRIFQTDALGRTIYTSEPERGETRYTYSYNATGMVVTRVRGMENQVGASQKVTTTTTQYDSLGRPISIQYANSAQSGNSQPTKTFTYDSVAAPYSGLAPYNIGSLTSASVAGGPSTDFVYDSMGRIVNMDQCFPGLCADTTKTVFNSYNFDQAGDLTQENYPLAGNFGINATTGSNTWTYDLAGNVASIANSQAGAVVSNVMQGANGPNSYNLPNNTTVASRFDTLGRRWQSWVCQDSNQPGCTGGLTDYGWVAQPNGNRITNILDTSTGKRSIPTYDAMNRLQSVVYQNLDCSYNSTMSWTYDRYGNRWSQSVSGGSSSAVQPSLTFDLTSNRIQGATYDGAGNMIQDTQGNTYTYDADGNLLSSTGGWGTATSTYDALNHRVMYQAGSSTTLYAFNSSGQRSAIYDSSENLLQNQVYWGGTPVAFIKSGTMSFQFQNWVGTAVFNVPSSGSSLSQYISNPYGDGFTTASGTDSDPYHYAGLDGDADGTMHAQFRNYHAVYARWLSPDPYVGSYKTGNPQTFNRYSYARNNPLSRVDRLGLDDDDDDGCDTEQGCSYNEDGGGGGGGGDPNNPGPCTTANCVSASGGPPDDPLDGTYIVSIDYIDSGTTGAPNNQSQKIAKQISNVNNCTQQMQGVLNGQPSVTPTTQNLLDGLYGAIFTVLTDGFGKVLSGFVKGASVRSVGHAVQKGGTALMTYNTCLVSAGQATPYNPYTPF